MQNLASYTRPAFLGDHPPVLARMIMESNGTETTCLAGSVLGRDANGKDRKSTRLNSSHWS